MQVAWCLTCARAVLFSLMADAESPATVFELVYTRFPDQPTLRIMYDNACNANHFFLNREPAFCKNIELYVDSFHFKGHKSCSHAYNTGALYSRFCVMHVQQALSDKRHANHSAYPCALIHCIFVALITVLHARTLWPWPNRHTSLHAQACGSILLPLGMPSNRRRTE